MKSLIEVMESQNDSPCVKYSCSRFQDCADELLACEAFRYYVRSGASVHPAMRIPVRVTSKLRPYMDGVADPTREVFDSLDRDFDTEDAAPDEQAILSQEIDAIIAKAVAAKPELSKVWA